MTLLALLLATSSALAANPTYLDDLDDTVPKARNAGLTSQLAACQQAFNKAK